MTDEGRASIAYTAGRVISRHNSTHLFDYKRSKYVAFSGSVSDTFVQIYNYDYSGHITGNGFGGILNLFDYHRSSHVQLRITGTSFSGFDYATGSHFSGSVSGQNINVYDYREGQYFNYSL